MRRKLLVGAGLSLSLLLVADQVVQHVALVDGELMGRPVAPFDPPLFAPAQRERLSMVERSLAVGDPPVESLRFDAELGWDVPVGGGGGEFRYDWAGARIGAAPLARDKAADVRRLAVYGCSMTHGDEVAAREAWPAQLDALLPAVEVANMGVSAYGLDQALLRMRRDGPAVGADEIWLVWMPEATLRITTLYRPFLRHWSLDVAFKPRLVIDPVDSALVAVPNPAREVADIPRLLSDQELLLERVGDHDPWVARARTAYAPRGSSWLHSSGLARVLLTAHESTGRDLARHLEDGRETRLLLEAIVLEAAREAEAMGAAFRLVILPGPTDLDDSTRPWSRARESLRAMGVDVVDLSADLANVVNPFADHGHLNAAGSAAAAALLAASLR